MLDRFPVGAVALAKRVVRRLRRLARPARLGNIRRTTPLSAVYGFDRGTPIDRYYAELFLKEHRGDIRGCVLEIGESRYADRFGGAIERLDILDIDPANARATIVADLTAADEIPSNSFDCFVFTFALQYMYDVRAALSHAHCILLPGGVLLLIMPGLTRLDPYGSPDYWRFTPASCATLMEGIFGAENVEVRPYGNVLSCVAALMGMASQELSRREIETQDEHFPLIIAVRAVK